MLKTTTILSASAILLGSLFWLMEAQASQNRILKPTLLKAPACNSNILAHTNLSTRLQVRGGEFLDKATLVAKEARHQILDANGNLAVFSQQKFTSGKLSRPELVCGEMKEGFSRRFVMNVPTLIDFSEKQKVGNSLWSFQIIPQSQGYSVLNQKSPVQVQSLGDVFSMSGAEVEVFQVSHNEFEIKYTKKVGNYTQTLLMYYDLVKL